MNEIIFIILFTLFVLASSIILYRQANGNYLRLITWLIRVYLFSLAVNVVVSSIRIINSGKYDDPKEYIFYRNRYIISCAIDISSIDFEMEERECSQGRTEFTYRIDFNHCCVSDIKCWTIY